MRNEVRELLARRDLPSLQALAAQDRRTLSALLPFTYQPDGLLRWRAVEAIGLVAGTIADRDPEFVRGFVRRFLWSLSDESGAVGWSAPEAVGEIVANRPALFADYAPIVMSLFDTLEEDYFVPGILWALGRIAQADPSLVREAQDCVIALLADSTPRVRGLAAWCLGQMCLPEAPEYLQSLFEDEHTLAIYEDGNLHTTTVGHLARRSAETSQNG
ncbi:MAG: HEAT repeat domain-containing protein [Dehalococcoidales bacterium]|nr:HEAT repeat domain-containing protein [Dehalococcoidales bacterium]